MKPLFHPQLVNDPFGDPALHVEFMFERRALLFDLGDLRALPPRKLLRISHVFVSHAHLDHLFGFDWLLRLSLGHDRLIRLFGPPGLTDRIGHKLAGYTWNLAGSFTFDLSFEVTDIGGGAEAGGPAAVAAARFQARTAFRREDLPAPEIRDGVLVDREDFRVRTAMLDHGTPCLAYALEERSHVNILKDRLAAAGLPVGPWLADLKRAVLRGAPDDTPIRVWWRDGDGPAPGAITLPLGLLKARVVRIAPGQKIAYVVDAAGHEENARRIVDLAQGADTLFIETAFLDEDAAQAAYRCHLTARQAGTFARRAGAKRLVPFHFSPRYNDREAALREEAERAFTGQG